MERIAGIDYGSKLAGTTAIASLFGREVRLVQSKKQADADEMIANWAQEKRPHTIYLDAPLSLPGCYLNLSGCDDFFYRKADRALGAMSPMFLGGLTARAMRLRKQLEGQGIRCVEVYPAALVKEMGWPKERYKKKGISTEGLVHKILDEQQWTLVGSTSAISWHQADALLALLSGYRHQRGAHLTYGMADEGFIVV